MRKTWVMMGAAGMLAAGFLVPAAAQGTGNARGKLLFLRCASCHAIAEGASAKIGPNLHGVVGRRAGSLPGYSYSAAMKAQNFVWDEAQLDRWLTRPTDVVPGTAMAFAGIANPADRKAVIAYLENPSP
jgi:cytochrome c